jgi:hypothetical protein
VPNAHRGHRMGVRPTWKRIHAPFFGVWGHSWDGEAAAQVSHLVAQSVAPGARGLPHYVRPHPPDPTACRFVEIRWSGGEVKHVHVAALGSIPHEPSVPERISLLLH